MTCIVKEFRVFTGIYGTYKRAITIKCTVIWNCGKPAFSNSMLTASHLSDLDRCDAILEGLPSAYCFKAISNELMHGNNPDYSRAIHAEARAFWACNKELARGGCLFTTSSSCENCTILANEYGIKNIYYIEKYAGIAQEHVAASGAQLGPIHIIRGRNWKRLYENVHRSCRLRMS